MFVCVVKDRSEVYIRTLRGTKVGRLIYFINFSFDGSEELFLGGVEKEWYEENDSTYYSALSATIS